MPHIDIDPKSRIFAHVQLMNTLEKACEKEEEVTVHRDDLLRVVKLARMGYSLQQREFSEIWGHLFPEKELSMVSPEDLAHFIELLKEAIHHMVGTCKVASKQLDLEELLASKEK